MKLGRFSLIAALGAALSASPALGAPRAPSSALAQKPVPGHAKPKNKNTKPKEKPSAKGRANRAAGGSAAPSAAPASRLHGAAPGGGGADSASVSGASSPIELALKVERVTLENGLRLVMHVDRTSPTVGISVVYDVGSRNEQKGRSGFAHLFEHMMFQGSANVPKGELARLITSRGGLGGTAACAGGSPTINGGSFGGAAGPDVSVYSTRLAANELALGLWLEADRMRSLDVTPDDLESQRRVVQEEIRGGLLNGTRGLGFVRREELVFQGYRPYERPPIGTLADLDAAKFEWVKDFHSLYYGPNNASLAIAGDFEPAEATALVRKYFGSIPRVAVPPLEADELPEQMSQRTAVVRSDFARTPQIFYGWAIPRSRHPDTYALELTAILLGKGGSSRLGRLLVREKAAVSEISVEIGAARRGPNLFSIDANLSGGAKVGDVEKLIEEEIKKLGVAGPSDAELMKARRQAASSHLFKLQSATDRALWLGVFEVLVGDANLLNEELSRFQGVTKDDIRRVIVQYLGPTRRTIVEAYPAKPKEPHAGAAAGDGSRESDARPAEEHKADAHKADAHKADAHKADAHKADAHKADTKKKKNGSKAGTGGKKKPSAAGSKAKKRKKT